MRPAPTPTNTGDVTALGQGATQQGGRHGSTRCRHRRADEVIHSPTSASFDPTTPLGRVPALDDQVVGRRADSRYHDLSDLDEEAVRPRRTVVPLDLGSSPRDLGITGPEGGVIVWVSGAAVQGYSGIASKVQGSPRAGHHPQRQAVISENNLSSTDPRRSVLSERCHGVVLVGSEQVSYSPCQVWLGGGERVPGAHGAILA
jgi:hypothetical protein